MLKKLASVTILLSLILVVGCLEKPVLTADITPANISNSAIQVFTMEAQAGLSALKAANDSNGKFIEPDNNTRDNTVVSSVVTLPDLIIDGITLLPLQPSVGDTVTFTVTTNNQGDAQSDYSSVDFYIDDIFQTFVSLKPLAPDVTATTDFTWKAQSGHHAIKVIIDANNIITESDETNNMQVQTFSVLAPDLLIEKITWLPSNPSVGDNITFSITIRNQGDERVNSARLYFYIDDSSRGYHEVHRIDAGSSLIENFTWTASVGSHEIKAIIDKDDLIIESDETNNEMTVLFLTLLPDLIIESITGPPANSSIGDIVTFTVTIKNQGAGRSDYSRAYFYRDKYFLSETSVKPIDPGADANYTFTWKVRAGPHSIRAIVDQNNTVIESDETNNERTVIFSNVPPDLVIESMTGSPESPSIGDNITFSVTIKNQGSGNTIDFRVYLYVDSRTIGYQDIPELAAGSSVIADFTWTARAGSHAIKSIVDKDDRIIESDETNNNEVVFFSTLPPDLIIESITSLPANPSLGDNVTSTVIIKNQGEGKSDYFYVDYYLDGTFLTSSYVDRLGPGGTVNQTFAWMIHADSHTIKVVVDSKHTVTESDEINNEKKIIISALLPSVIPPLPIPAAKPAPAPVPAPAPGIELRETPGDKETVVHPTKSGIPPGLWFVLAGVVSIGMLIAVFILSRWR